MAGLRASQTCGGCATRAPASESFSGPWLLPGAGGRVTGSTSLRSPSPRAPSRTPAPHPWQDGPLPDLALSPGDRSGHRRQIFQGKAGAGWATRFGKPFSSAAPLPTPWGGAQVPERNPIPHDSSAQIPHPPGLSPPRVLLLVAVSLCSALSGATAGALPVCEPTSTGFEVWGDGSHSVPS